MKPQIKWEDLQGNILRGYRKKFVRHLVLSIDKPIEAMCWLDAATSGDPTRAPQITTATLWPKGGHPKSCVNLGITYKGFEALGLAEESLASFSHEFVAGMPASNKMIGDTGPSDPAGWKREWQNQASVHLMISIYADDAAERDAVSARVLGESKAFRQLAALDGENFGHSAEDKDHGKVHFGYRDSISQPQFFGVHDSHGLRDDQPLVEIGAILLGYATPVEDLRWRVPTPPELGFNGSYNAFRVLEQRVEEFEEFLTACADKLMEDPLGNQLLPPGSEETWEPPRSRHQALRELVAAKMMGRWFNGVPLELSPFTPTPDPPIDPKAINDYGYASDPDGQRCPVGSHMRRSNPRDARIVQRNTNHARRLVRRGVPYGPHYDPLNPVKVERGLLGSFMCADLSSQFEAIMYDWINLGLIDPHITGTNDSILGNNDPMYSRFSFPVGEGEVVFRGFERFVHTRGGAYFFQPSISAIRYLASLAPNQSSRRSTGATHVN